MEDKTNRTVAGTKLVHLEDRWVGTISGETWAFAMIGPRHWQGFTLDHLTGTPRCLVLRDAVEWVQKHQDVIQAKLSVRRAAGTRMVDPPGA